MKRTQLRSKDVNKLLKKYNLNFSKKDQVELISKQVEQVEAADEARRIEREAEDKRLADSFKAPVQAETEETGKSQD